MEEEKEKKYSKAEYAMEAMKELIRHGYNWEGVTDKAWKIADEMYIKQKVK